MIYKVLLFHVSYRLEEALVDVNFFVQHSKQRYKQSFVKVILDGLV